MVDCNVEIGDIVFIGGIYGDDFKIINNKVGKIKKIIFSSSERYSTYLVDVMISGKVYPVNLNYVYRLDDLDTYDYAGLFEGEEPPLEHYLKLFKIVGNPVMLYDQSGLNYLYCKTREDNIKPLSLTSLN